METGDPPHSGRQHTIAAKLDADQMARFEHAVTAAGLSRSAFIRAAVLRHTIPLRPFEALMADAIRTLALCQKSAASGIAVDGELIMRLDELIAQLHRLADMRAA